jgi:hypothetical protein
VKATLLLVALATSAFAAEGGPDCHGFGGMIHGLSACARLDLAKYRIEPLEVRVMPGDGTQSVGCNQTLKANGHALEVLCIVHEAHRRVTVSVSVDGKKPLKLDAHQGFWDQLNVWVRPQATTVDFTIDYIVLD